MSKQRLEPINHHFNPFRTNGKWTYDRLTEDADFYKKKIIFSDEAPFDLSKYVQAKLSHLGHRKSARIHSKADAPRTSHYLGEFWSSGIIGPFFFENELGEVVTVNGDCYRAMLNEFMFTKIEEEDIGNIWFQQDGAT